MPIPLRKILPWIALFTWPTFATPAQADATAPAPVATPGTAPASDDRDTISRIRDLFEIDLPMTERMGQVKLNFQPHFRDFIDKSYLRIPLELRWGVNNHFELNSDIDTYITHGLRDDGAGYGISDLHFGAKYAWLKWLKPTWDTSVGINVSIPVSRPPIELTDGHDHFTPYIVFGRQLDGVQGLSGIFHASVDMISASPTPGNFGRNEPHTNSLSLTPGLLYDRGPWHYTLEIDGTTTRIIGSGSHDLLTIRPGVVWDLPKALKFHARGRWLAGFNLTLVFGPDGNTISTGGRFKGEVNLTHWFYGNQSADSEPPAPAPGH
jgi:hypothetical protein